MGKSEMICDCDIVHKEIVEKVKNEILDGDMLLNIANFYKALSDSTRIRIINALDCNEMCVCDIAVLLNMTKSAVSHQLKYLKDMDIIKSKKEGKVVFYSLADDHVKQVFEVSLEHILEKNNENEG